MLVRGMQNHCMIKFYRRIANTRWFDFAAALPLIVFYIFAIWGMILNAIPDIRGISSQFDELRLLSVGSTFATIMFLVVQIVLFVVRVLPLERAAGFLPRAAAIIGANLQITFVLLPRAEHGVTVRVASLLLVIVGTAASVYVVSCLGKSFSILPQARSLRFSGPYRIIRHPLYLAEQIATLGVMFQFAAPWSVIIAAASFAAQFPRMHFEEAVLKATFPAYRDYVRHTARLIPGIY